MDIFDADTGAFEEAFGWGVKTGASKFQVCTSSCHAGTAGEGSGQINEPWSIAVDPASGNLYIGEIGNRRVQKFDPNSGTEGVEFLLMFGGGVDKTMPGDLCTAASGHVCGAGALGSGEGEFFPNYHLNVAVNQSGDVYAADEPPDVAGGGQGRLQVFEPSGTLKLPGRVLYEEPTGSPGATGIAFDSTGDFWVSSTKKLRKYDMAGSLPPLKEISTEGRAAEAIAVGASDEIFVGASDGTSFQSSIREYDAEGTLQLRFGYGELATEPEGLALYHSANGDVFVSGRGLGLPATVQYLDVPKVGPLVYPASCGATSLGNSQATLGVRIDPEGKATKYHFEIVSDGEFQVSGFGGATRVPALPSADPSLAASFEMEQVSVVAEGLRPETEYHCEVVAENADGDSTGEEGAFVTKEPFEVTSVWASAVGSGSATVDAEVNGLGIPATAHFEYVTQADYEKTGWTDARLAPEGEEIEVGEGLKSVSATLPGLESETVYRYRVVGADSFFPGGVSRPQYERMFRTYGVSGGVQLPDGRGWEMVSPDQKDGAELGVPNDRSGLYLQEEIVRDEAAASSGEAVTYTSWNSFGKGEGAPPDSQYLSKRTANGWVTQNISPPGFLLDALEPPYRGFSPDLKWSSFVVDQPALTAGAVVGWRNAYLRNDETGEVQALTTEVPQFTAENSTVFNRYCTSYAGASTDGKRAFFAADGALAGAPIGVGFSLYEWSSGGLRLVSVLPDGTPAPPQESTSFGAGSGLCRMTQTMVANAVSEDGSTVYWTYGGKYKTSTKPLLASIDGAGTVQLDARAAGGIGSGRGVLQTVTADGSKAFFTDVEKLDGGAGVGDLYRYELNKPETERLTNVTPGASSPEILGVIGISQSGDYLYFVAKSVLTGPEENSAHEKAEQGADNLYVWHEGETPTIRFVAKLSEDDQGDWSANPNARKARVGANGDLAFLTIETEALSGYDNQIQGGGGCELGEFGGSRALNGGSHCTEVYLYDAADQQLTCASCNPSGARPKGPATLPTWSNPFEGRRYLSSDGSKVFFESLDVLSPQDENHRGNVYEFERAGAGSCTSENASLDPSAGGCIFLISTGQSESESYLLDASADGRDVFIATRQSLVGSDTNENYDIYDAREAGGFPEPPPPPPACEGEASCRTALSPPPSLFAPASAGLFGPGNLLATPELPASKQATKTQAKCKKGFTAKGHKCVRIQPGKKHKHKHSTNHHKNTKNKHKQTLLHRRNAHAGRGRE